MELSRVKLNVIMAERGLSVAQMAELYGVTRQRMSVILNAAHVSPATAGKLAKALQVTVEEIIK